MDGAPEELIGCFVVEVGERQAWPFLTFVDTRPTPAMEARLYLDCEFTVDQVRVAPRSRGATPLLVLNMLAVTAVTRDSTAMVVAFGDEHELRISNEADELTTGDVWWMSPWTTA
ncbi:MAG TPA: hypothetical protein PKE05_09560 [Microthrixaceae bacterium]|nr:hypothetical protein [Microthrixaceae bacterium]